MSIVLTIFGGTIMNNKTLALVFGLMLNIVPVYCADSAPVEVQEPTVQVCTDDACPVAEAPELASEVIEPIDESCQAPEFKSTPENAPEAQPEQELTEEQLKEFIDQLTAELK